MSTLGAFALLTLTIGGHVLGLRLIDVKPYADFQHYYPWRLVLGQHAVAACLLLAQAIAVAVLSWRMRRRLVMAMSGILSMRSLMVIAVLAAASLAVPTVSVSRSLGEVVLAGGLAVVATLNLVIAVLMVPEAAISRAQAWVDDRVTLRPGTDRVRRWDLRLPLVVALWVTIVAAGVNYAVLERLPHIEDGVSYLFQAKYFAAGRLFLPPPPDAESFRMDLTLVAGGKWYGYAFPGWPLLLSLGVLAGVPWLVNPILGGMTILLGHGLIRRRYDRGTANASVLMLAVSPWLIFMSAEFMTHPLTAVLALLAMLAFDRASGRTHEWGRWARWAMTAGLATGALVLTRTVDAALLVAAIAIATLLAGRLKRAMPAAIVAGLLTAAAGGLLLVYNKALTGRATYPPHLAWADGRWGPGVDRFGFGHDVGIRAWPNLDPLPGHGLPDVVLNANKNLFMTNVELFGWPTGSLIFIWLAFGLGRWRAGDALMLALSASFALGYSAYWFSGGPDLGPRYWYPLIMPFAALTARGAHMLVERLEEQKTLDHAGARIGALILAASVSAAVATVPWRAVTKHYRYRGITGEVRALAASHRFGHALVFIRSSDTRRDYQSAFSLNPPTLDDPATIYARDAGPAHRAAVVAHFPDRPVWVIGRNRDNAQAPPRFEVIAGPLAPGTVPR